MKRFYETVAVRESEAGYAITLDGRPVRTPARQVLAVPTRALAEGIEAEWAAQEDEVRPAAMPLTRLANSALDTVPAYRERIVAEIVRFAETDLVCYRADDPPGLAARQAEVWQPLLDWLALRHGAALDVVSGVVPVRQPPPALRAVHGAVAGLDDFRLTALHAMVTVCGSVVIGLAMAHGELDAEGAWQASSLDETYQMEQWGEDEIAAARRVADRHSLFAAARFLSCLGEAGV